MAAFLIRAKGLTQLFPATPSFADVPARTRSSVHRTAQAEGITTGCNPPSNNMYCPLENVPRQQMAAFLSAPSPRRSPLTFKRPSGILDALAASRGGVRVSTYRLQLLPLAALTVAAAVLSGGERRRGQAAEPTCRRRRRRRCAEGGRRVRSRRAARPLSRRRVGGRRAAVLGTHGARRERDSPLPRLVLARLAPGTSVMAAVEALSRRPEVAFAEPNWIYRAAATPNDRALTASVGASARLRRRHRRAGGVEGHDRQRERRRRGGGHRCRLRPSRPGAERVGEPGGGSTGSTTTATVGSTTSGAGTSSAGDNDPRDPTARLAHGRARSARRATTATASSASTGT